MSIGWIELSLELIAFIDSVIGLTRRCGIFLKNQIAQKPWQRQVQLLFSFRATADTLKHMPGIIVLDLQIDFTLFKKGTLAAPGTDERFKNKIRNAIYILKRMILDEFLIDAIKNASFFIITRHSDDNHSDYLGKYTFQEIKTL